MSNLATWNLDCQRVANLLILVASDYFGAVGRRRTYFNLRKRICDFNPVALLPWPVS